MKLITVLTITALALLAVECRLVSAVLDHAETRYWERKGK